MPAGVLCLLSNVCMQEYTLFGVLVFLVSCYLCVEYHEVHSVVLEPAIAQYSIYISKTLITMQHSHNIYVRMRRERTGKWVLEGR